MTHARHAACRACRRRRSPLALALGFLFVIFPALVNAGPRQDAMSASIDASEQLDQLEIEASLATLDTAIASAEAAGLASDPVLADLHALRAGLIFATTNGNRAQTLPALQAAVRCDWNVQLPIELRSEELTALLEEARSGIPRPAEAIIHTAPAATKAKPIEFAALVNVQLPPDAQVVMYWRKQGSEVEFLAVNMQLNGNFGLFEISEAEHGDTDLEYFFYAFDARQQSLANRGDKENPMVLEFGDEGAGAGGAGGDGGDGGGEGGDDGKKKKKKKKKPESGLPRVFINLGVGTGFGIARGQAEQTFQQYTPGTQNTIYGLREQACAVERWFEAGAPLAQDAATFQANLATIDSVPQNILPAQIPELVANYDPSYCGAHHPVSTGLALAPFHIAPEVGVRVSPRIVVSLFTRLQVVTGSKVYTDDPGKELGESFSLDVRSPMPPGVRRKPPFTWAIGAKVKYFLGKDQWKFRPFVGGFAGYGFARLRVPMGFSNDRNGNSVPDAFEAALHGELDAEGNIRPETCVPVWPYNSGCEPSSGPMGAEGDLDRTLAMQVRGSTPTTDERIDTVRIGPGFMGAALGFNYQVVKYFALFFELDVGGWFPSSSSLLFDINLGPAITF